MVFHYPFEPWKVIDAEESGDKSAVRAVTKPILYGQEHAEAEFADSDSYWHFDSHKGSDEPRLRLFSNGGNDQSCTEPAAHCDDENQPIGVLIEFCCSKESILCDEKYEYRQEANSAHKANRRT